MLSMYKFDKIRGLWATTGSYSAVADALGIDRRTVKKYVTTNAPPKYKPRERPTKEDPFAAFEQTAVKAIETAPELSGLELFELLVEAGYEGSLRTVERKMAKLRRKLRPKERFFEQKYTPGEQCQLDFKECFEIPFVDGTRLCHLLIGTLPYSDAFSVKAFPFRTYEAFADGMHSFFEHVGGLPENVRIDNLSPCVAKIRSGKDRLYTDAFSRAIRYYGFGVLPCRPGVGSDKGDVERDIRTYARRLRNQLRLSGRVFIDFADLNAWLADFVLGRTSEKIQERLTEERRALKPLPPRDAMILCKVNDTRATTYGTVRIGRSSYSVPDEMIDRPCRVVLTGHEVVVHRIGDGGGVVARHPRKEDGDHSLLLEHVLPSLIRKPGAMVRWAHRHILFPLPPFKQFYDYLKGLPGVSAEREFLRSVNLVFHASIADVAAGMDVVREQQSRDPYIDLRRLIVVNDRDQVAALLAAAPQPPINPELSKYDSLIPA
jgi:transposase